MTRVALAVAVIFLVLGCQQQPKHERVLARVGDVILTEAQARAAMDTSLAPYETQVRKYVSSWVITELLYQEAMKRGIEQNNRFQQQLADVRKQLAVQEFLQTFIYADTGVVAEDSVRQYFDRHAEEFIVREDMIKMNILGFTNREPANIFAAQVTRGASWENSYKKIMNDPATANEIVFVSTGKYYSQRTLMFPELWKVAQTLGENDISFPIRTSSGFYVIQMLTTVHSGSNPDFEVVREEARVRFIREQQQHRYDSLIGTLQQRYSVELLLPAVQQNDTSRQLFHD